MSDVSSSDHVVLPTGEKVYFTDSRVVSPAVEQTAAGLSREIVSGRQASQFLERTHRKLGDLPDSSDRLNPICAVITYTAIGLSDEDIATALKTTVSNITKLRELDAYAQLTEMFDKTVFEDERRNAKHIIARASSRAAVTMVSLVEDRDPNIAINASREVLKMTGISTDDERAKMLSGLKITFVKDDGKGETVKVTLGE